jgi:hypothetical protein
VERWQVFDIEGSQDEQSPRTGGEDPQGRSEEEEEDYQDAPEEFVSPSSSFRSFSGGAALMGWGRRCSMQTGPQTSLLTQQAKVELDRRLVLLSVGGPADQNAVRTDLRMYTRPCA